MRPAIELTREENSAFNRKVGLRVRHARIQRGVSQELLACRIGVSRRMLSAIECGAVEIEMWRVWCVSQALQMRFSTFVPVRHSELEVPDHLRPRVGWSSARRSTRRPLLTLVTP